MSRASRCATNTERPVTIELGTNTLLGPRAGTLARGTALCSREPKHGRSRRSGTVDAGERAAERVERLAGRRSPPEGLGGHDGVGASLVFRPLIRLLRERGDEVEITARDYAQTLQLLELHGPRSDGDRPPRRPLAARQGTLAHLASRALRTWARPRELRPRARARLTRADDERTATRHPERDDARLRVRDAAAPARHARGDKGGRARVDPARAARSVSACDRRSCCAIPGLKEEYYLSDFEPDPTVLDELGVDRDRVLVVLRPAARRLALPPPLEPALPADARLSWASLETVQAVVLPRTDEQRVTTSAQLDSALGDRPRPRRRRAEPDRARRRRRLSPAGR